MPVSLVSDPPFSLSPNSSQAPGPITTMDPRTKTPENEDNDDLRVRYPTAIIDTESISDVMAARLTTCLLAHVLYLKSQVPFPVAQLSKMTPSGKTNNEYSGPNMHRLQDARTDRKQSSLLSSFDTLSSHLGSTFSALSGALSELHGNSWDAFNSIQSQENIAPAYLAIVFGPSATSISAARARVMLEIDGLLLQSPHDRTSGKAQNKSWNGKENMYGVSGIETPKSASREVLSEKVLREAGDCVDDPEDTQSVTDSASEPEGSDDAGSDSSEYESEDESEVDLDCGYCEADFLAAERVLSRTLAMANADPELGMAADIPLTQAHIFLRAPRRFVHPAWIPRPGVSRDMDSALHEFEDEFVGAPASRNDEGLNDITNLASGSHNSRPVVRKAPLRKKGPRTDCVRVRCSAPPALAAREEYHKQKEQSEDDATPASDDLEMIWWSWDGRLEGFSW